MIKNVYFLLEDKAQLILPKSNTAMISITEPGKTVKLHPMWNRSNLIRLQFHDYDQKIINSKIEISNESINFKLFSPKDAKIIIDFLFDIKNRVDNVFVCCASGIFRSAAIAKFISEIYKLPFPEHYMLYNKFIYKTLINTYNNIMWREDYEP